MSDYEVSLERSCDAEGRLGSFGLSILGGFSTKFPAVVCEIDPGGPADGTGLVKVGDRLRALNGEDLSKLTPKDLVSKIRTAPSPSIFSLSKDEELRQQVIQLLRKQERRAAARREKASGGLEVADRRPHRKVVHTSSNSSFADERKKKIMSKIIEVEPSVNINDGRSGDIVQVYHNKIVGVVETPIDSDQHSDREMSPSRSGRQKSPRHMSPASTSSAGSDQGRGGSDYTGSPRSPRQQMKNMELPNTLSPYTANTYNSHDVSESEIIGHTDAITDEQVNRGLNDTNLEPVGLKQSEKSQHRSASPPEFPITPSPEHTSQETTKSSPNTNQISHDTTSPFQDTDQDSVMLVRTKEGDDSAVASGPGDLESSGATASPREQDSGVALHIPNWTGHEVTTIASSRASLSEAILIEELERSQKTTPPSDIKEGEEENAVAQSPKAQSPLIDPEKREELMRKYRNTPTRSSSKRKDDPYTKAVSLARRLYMLDGFRKSEVAERLSDQSEFGQTVAKEYLRFFEFEKLSLDESLRQFLSSFLLTGESQERERIMVHFSDRYFESNPDNFPTVDTVHGLTIALLLLNTDLHNDHGSTKMSFSQFVTNLERIGVKLPRDMLRKYYSNIRKKPLEWAVDEIDEPQSNHTETNAMDEVPVRVYHVTIPGTFVEVELPENAPLFKEGFVLRKNVMEGPHKKVPRGKRQWRPYYAYLKGFLLYFGEPQGELHLEDTSSAIPVCHCLAMGAFDYNKKNSVLRITTSDWHSFLLQANNVTDMQQWIGAVNKAAAQYSSAPLAAPISSSSTFVRPTFPLAPTRNTIEQQIESHEARTKSLDKEAEEHQAYKPKGSKAKHNQLQVWFDKFEFLQYQMSCYRIYFASLTSNEIINFNQPLPSGLVPSPSVSTLAVTGTSYDLDLQVRESHSPSSQRKSHVDISSSSSKLPGSPLARKKGGKS